MQFFFTKNGVFIYFDKNIEKKLSLEKLSTYFFGICNRGVGKLITKNIYLYTIDEKKKRLPFLGCWRESNNHVLTRA